MFAAANKRFEREHNERAWAVWHVAAMSRAKRMPKLHQLQARSRLRPQSWQEQAAIMQMWAAKQQQARSMMKEDSHGR